MFACVATAASALLWLLVMLLTFRLLSPDPAIFIAVLSVAIFPVLAIPFAARIARSPTRSVPET